MGGDVDGDGICNNADNCPDHPNPGQENCNGSDSGDVCEIADCPAMDPACFDCNANGVPGACDDPPAYTTVMTLMNQLAAKGAFEVDRCRQPFVYCPAVRRDQVLNQRLRHFLHTVFDGQAGELVLRLVDDDRLSPEDLKRIEARIEARERVGR